MTHITIYRERDIRQRWPQLSQGLDAIISRAPDNLGWNHHHVLGRLMHDDKNTFLYIVEVNDNYAGFIVTRHLWDEFTRKPVFLVWFMYLEKDNILDEAIRFCLAEGKQHHCKYVRFESNRQGWHKIVQKYGGSSRYTIYEKEI